MNAEWKAIKNLIQSGIKFKVSDGGSISVSPSEYRRYLNMSTKGSISKEWDKEAV